MNIFETTLLRERFTINNRQTANHAKLTALSNRVCCPLYNRKGGLVEEFIIRGQNIYTCIRLLSRLVNAFDTNGSLIQRAEPFVWERAWNSALSSYEKRYNPETWGAIYYRGKVIFAEGKRHPFVDMIEKYAAMQPNAPYENAVSTAEKAFEQSGKSLSIEYDANVAFVITVENSTVRCASIIRGIDKTTTFNFTSTLSKKDQHIGLAPFISASAAQAEAIQLSFIIGLLRYKQETNQLGVKEPQKLREATARLVTLQAEIANLETSYKINYRPEKPNLAAMVEDAKNAAKKLL